MKLLRDLLEMNKVVENATADAHFDRLKGAFEEKEAELFDMLDQMKVAIEAGEFKELKQLARKLEDMAHATNETANKLADIKG